MTTSQIDTVISSLVTPYLDSLRGHLATLGVTNGTVSPSDFHSLLSWHGTEGQYTMLYNDRAAVLFKEDRLAGVAAFDTSLLSDGNREERFKLELHQALGEGGL